MPAGRKVTALEFMVVVAGAPSSNLLAPGRADAYFLRSGAKCLPGAVGAIKLDDGAPSFASRIDDEC